MWLTTLALMTLFGTTWAIFELVPNVWRGVRGREGTAASVLIAYQVTTLAGNVYLAAAGWQAWSAVETASAEDHLYLDLTYVRDHLLAPLRAHLLSDCVLYVALPELRNAPMLLVHHLITGMLAVLATEPSAYCHYYIIFFAGVAEVSNVPLAFLELGRLLPLLPEAYPRLHGAAWAAFSVSFFTVRVLYWPTLAVRFWLDSLGTLHDNHRAQHWPVVRTYLVANAILTAMQLGWSFKLARRLLHMLPAIEAMCPRRALGHGKSRGSFRGPIFVATMEWRQRQLVAFETTRPALVFVYRASCWAYSLVGITYAVCLPRLPSDFQNTAIMSGRAFAACLVIQGVLSFVNDAICTFGYQMPGPRELWLIADRLVATSLTVNAIATARVWGASDQSGAPKELAIALVLSFAFFIPSRFSEITGRMQSFLFFHSCWHCLPCVFASSWIILSACRHAFNAV